MRPGMTRWPLTHQADWDEMSCERDLGMNGFCEAHRLNFVLTFILGFHVHNGANTLNLRQ